MITNTFKLPKHLTWDIQQLGPQFDYAYRVLIIKRDVENSPVYGAGLHVDPQQAMQMAHGQYVEWEQMQ